MQGRGRWGAGPSGAWPGCRSQWGAAARGGRPRGDAGARWDAEVELPEWERIRWRAQWPRHPPGSGYLAAPTVSRAPRRSRLCGVSGSGEPPSTPQPRLLVASSRLAASPGARAVCPRDAGAEGPGSEARSRHAALPPRAAAAPPQGPTPGQTGPCAGNV